MIWEPQIGPQVSPSVVQKSDLGWQRAPGCLQGVILEPCWDHFGTSWGTQSGAHLETLRSSTPYGFCRFRYLLALPATSWSPCGYSRYSPPRPGPGRVVGVVMTRSATASRSARAPRSPSPLARVGVVLLLVAVLRCAAKRRRAQACHTEGSRRAPFF